MMEEQPQASGPQVGPEEYFGSAYICPGRFAAYSYYVKAVVEIDAESVLEVGVGNGFVAHVLRSAGLNVTTLDFDERLGPDIVASVTNMPVEDSSFDVVTCYEVLEHMPWEKSVDALSEIQRVAGKSAVLSVPDRRRFYRCEISLPKFGRKRFSLELPYLRPPEMEFDGQHYWELNTKGYPLKRFMDAVREIGFDIAHEERVWENPSHHLFHLSVEKDDEGS